VTKLFVDGVDVVADTVFGRAAPGTDVEVWVHDDGNLTVAADGSGNWTADFSGLTDLTYQSNGGSQQTDPDGDSTSVWWAKPQFQVSPDDNWVGSWNRWIPGSIISLTIEDGAGVVYSDSQTADTHGEFSFNVWSIDIVTGHLVTVSDVTTTRSHTVTALTVTNIDTAADRIHGTANPDAQVGVWVNLFDEGSHRRVTADSDGNWMADFSNAADGEPAFDITEITRITAREFDDDGDSTNRQFGPPVQQNRGVAVTPIDNHVWVANSGVATVTRLDNDGNVLKVIDTGEEPTGVAVDAAGKVWATNMGSNNAVRIDPNAGPDGLGALDLTVDLGPEAWPYNYSDMTGAVVVGSTSPQGLWTVIQDSQTPGFQWGRITWNNEPEGSEPAGTAIVVEARAADTEAGLGGQTFLPVLNGDLFSMLGRYIEVRVTLKASPEGASPVLADIRISPHVIYVDIDIKPGSDPNSINCENQKETITVAVLTTDDFDATIVDHTTVTFEGASEMHVNKKTGEPRRHEADVDEDGDMDLEFHFRLGDTALTCESTQGMLIGEIYDGIPIEGSDSVRMIGELDLFASGLWGPFGMAFDESGDLFVANEGSGGGGTGVSRITSKGEVSTFATGLNGPAGVAFNSEGVLHVSDDTDRVFHVSDTGELDVFVDWDVGLSNPNAIAIDKHDNLYTVSCGGFVSWFDPDGSLIDLTLADGFDCPQSIVVDDSAGVLFISDMGGNIFRIDKETGDTSLYVETLSFTEGGLTMDRQGNLYFSAYDDGLVLQILASDLSISTCLSGLITPRGLAFDSKGKLFVTSYTTDQIFRANGCTQ
jgi:streptogramin lyase